MADIVLDSSAIIAYLRGEQGQERVVKALLDDGTVCWMHAVNLCEIFYDSLRSSGVAVAENIFADLASAGVHSVSDLDVEFLKEVGRIKVQNRISLADSFALALKRRLKAELLTADRHEFAAVAAAGEVGIVFIR